MQDNKTESLWEHVESYDAGDSFLGKTKTYSVVIIYLGFLFVAVPAFIAFPLARGLGLQDLSGFFLIGSEVVIYLAGKSIRFKTRNK